MKLKCPECKKVLDSSLNCINGHSYQEKGGVLRLMNAEFSSVLLPWLADFEDFRSSKQKKLDYDGLPDSGLAENKHLWSARKEDLKIIERLIGGRAVESALDIGSWNGWLANKLSQKEIEVTAVDYFVHDIDGMGAKKYFKDPNWRSIQMNLEDLSVFEGVFDLIVVNRSITYFSSLESLITDLKRLVSKNGMILITGINVHQKIEKQTDELINTQKEFKQKYDRDIMFKPIKGYVDKGDLVLLGGTGFELKVYSGFRNKLKSKVLRKGYVSHYAIYQNKS